MTTASVTALPHRALIAVSGPDWARFLKGLCTAHIDNIVEETARGEFHRLHYGAFLRPQGKMICDVLLHAVSADEIWLDVPLPERDDLLAKLNMYKLRAKVTITTPDHPVYVAFGGDLPEGFMTDPRGSIIDGVFGFAYAAQTETASDWDWIMYRMARGLSDPGFDFGKDEMYAIDANLDLLGAIDFHKGCYVGQELTSRMKRRGQIKNRIMPFRYENEAPEEFAEILKIDRRAGEVLMAGHGLGLGLMRVDRRDGDLTVEGRPLTLIMPGWITPTLPELTSE